MSFVAATVCFSVWWYTYMATCLLILPQVFCSVNWWVVKIDGVVMVIAAVWSKFVDDFQYWFVTLIVCSES